ncbi:MAG: transposase [Terriglobia bacterium]
MKASKKAHSGFLFISGSTYRRITIFRYKKPCGIFLKTLEAYRRKYALRVYAYALMPNHYHLLLWFPPQHRLVNFLRDFKSLAARQILEWLHHEKLNHLLAHFELKRTPRREKDARYCVFQYNSYVKALLSTQALRQKVEYIHSNPVREGLAPIPEAYRYSSAGAYARKGLSFVKIHRLELPYD